MGLERSGAVLDPLSFADPERQVYSLDDNTVAPSDLTQKYRLLPKKEVSRRLNAQAAGMGHASEPPWCNGTVAASSIQGLRVPTSAAAVTMSLQQPSLQVSARGTLQLTLLSAAAVSGRPPPLRTGDAECRSFDPGDPKGPSDPGLCAGQSVLPR